MKNFLIVDDSALMRKVICDIIESDSQYHVEEVARDGQEAYDLLKVKSYDIVILDINMPRMTGIELLKALKRDNIKAKVIMASTFTTDGGKETMQALELGALDFVTKPGNFIEAKGEQFHDELLRAIDTVVALPAALPVARTSPRMKKQARVAVSPRPHQTKGRRTSSTRNHVVALACSTGGPKSLQSVIPKLPANLDAAVLIVQHMPAGFTSTLASRLNELSAIEVKEAEDGEEVKKGVVYIAPGGRHLMCHKVGSTHKIMLNDDPPRDALRPCANIMYDSLLDCGYQEVVCVVLTGMGADGTEGITHLKDKKEIYVISQDAESSIVYGMPKAIAQAGLSNEVVPLEIVADSITKYVGVC